MLSRDQRAKLLWPRSNSPEILVRVSAIVENNCVGLEDTGLAFSKCTVAAPACIHGAP